ncbi:MAG: hypothetical protein P8K78_06960 [Pirellulales bacterium]|nr:hypothetical protein [Pirellulales bacterium]
MDKRVTCTLIVPLLLTIQAISHQSVRAEETSAKPTAAAPTKAPKADDAKAKEEAEREKIWNSPEMLKARIRVHNYLTVVKKYTPEQKANYEKHLASLTVPQMETWLIGFEQDEANAKKQEKNFDTVRNAQLARDKSQIKQNQKSLSDIEKGENVAAADEEKRLKSEQTFARSMYRQKQREATRMLEEYSSGGFGWGFGMGMR